MMRRLFVPVACVAALGLAAGAATSPARQSLRAPSACETASGGSAENVNAVEPSRPDVFGAVGTGRLRRRGPGPADGERAGRRTPGSRTSRRVVSREQVTVGGCRYFLQHGTLEMDALALSLSISRATLYRVVQSRDHLLADVLWRMAENALWHARKSRRSYGADGVLEVGRRFSALLIKAAPFRHFLATEPETAARVLLTATGGIHTRAVSAQKEIFLEAAPPDGEWVTGDADDVAYLLVRIFESVCYAELLAQRPPDRALAERAIRAILPGTH